MANVFYDPGTQRAAKVNALFNNIARRYDLINDVQSGGLHRWWKRRLVRMADVRAGSAALDLCCGTGDIAFALAKHGARVTGLDFSEAMLAVARERAKAQPGCAVGFLQGDAMHLPFADDSFDAVTVGYGLRNLVDPVQGLREMHRVARPGGRLLVLDFGKPSNRLWRKLYYGYLRCMVPVFGRVFCGNWAAYAYILESLEHYMAQEGVAAAMREMGCREVRVLNFFGGAMSINAALK